MPGEPLARPSKRRTAFLGAVAALIATGTACGTGHPNGPANPLSASPVGELPPVLSHTVAVTVTSARGCQSDNPTYAAGELLVSITNQDAA